MILSYQVPPGRIFVHCQVLLFKILALLLLCPPQSLFMFFLRLLISSELILFLIFFLSFRDVVKDRSFVGVRETHAGMGSAMGCLIHPTNQLLWLLGNRSEQDLLVQSCDVLS